MLATVIAIGAVAERAPKSFGADPRVRYVWYNPVDVVRLDTNLGVITAVELGSSERIQSVLLGDSKAYDVNVLSDRQTIAIKPVIAAARSNLTIYTDRRVITFALTEGLTRMPTYRVVLKYPADGAPSPAGPARQDQWRDLGYAYSGGPANLRPKRVWNDGEATYFEFGPDVRPGIFGVNPEGYEVVLNSGTRGASTGDTVVRVPGLRRFYSVRIGSDVVCIARIAGGVRSDAATLKALKAMEF